MVGNGLLPAFKERLKKASVAVFGIESVTMDNRVVLNFSESLDYEQMNPLQVRWAFDFEVRPNPNLQETSARTIRIIDWNVT